MYCCNQYNKKLNSQWLGRRYKWNFQVHREEVGTERPQQDIDGVRQIELKKGK